MKYLIEPYNAMRFQVPSWVLLIAALAWPGTALDAFAAERSRVTAGLLVLYTFETGSGNLVRDSSMVGRPLDLTINDDSAVKWREGALVVESATKIQSSRPASKVINAIKDSGEITLEAWLQPGSERQSGPARIVSVSADSGQRNVTLGQDGKKYEVRFRTRTTGRNGIPSLSTRTAPVATRRTHVVYTREKSGLARIYINGEQAGSRKVAGRLSNWDNSFRLLLANEATADRPWLGSFHLVSIYGRALSGSEVQQNYRAGADADTRPPSEADLALSRNRDLFETQIAPLLARNCLDCHDAASRKGQLDLSRKPAAFAGGESGPAIVPGKAADSLLWQLIKSGDMPAEAEPLSPQAQELVRKWIDAGATWSLEVIDPAIYAHAQSGSGNWVRRLTVGEYIATVQGAVGVDIAAEARELLPPDLRADGFSNTAYNLNVDLKHVEAYARLAEIIVDRMDVMKFASRFSKSRSLSTDDTMRQFVRDMGKWLLRGPLDDREITIYSGIATTVASAGGRFEEAAGLLIESFLQSPRFIYRIEEQRGDGTVWPVGDFELASRISYMVWGAPPDEELMRAAEAGQLHDEAVLSSQVERMLKDPRAIARSAQFLSEWLDLDRLENLRPNRDRFPDWDPALAADMRAETLAYFQEIVWQQDRPLADLLNARFTYATPRLAKHYGLQPQGDGLSRYDLSSVPSRGGLLTQGSVLTVGGDDASMVTRGLFLLHDVLRGTVKDPPPGLDTTPVPSQPGLSQRSISEQRIGNVACGGCHAKFEPLAFGLEKFDGLGMLRERDEHGNQLREDGQILFPGAEQPMKYQSASEMMDLLAGSDRVRESITWKLTQFALGRPLGAADARTVSQIHKTAQQAGGTYASLISAIASSELVTMTRTEDREDGGG